MVRCSGSGAMVMTVAVVVSCGEAGLLRDTYLGPRPLLLAIGVLLPCLFFGLSPRFRSVLLKERICLRAVEAFCCVVPELACSADTLEVLNNGILGGCYALEPLCSARASQSLQSGDGGGGGCSGGGGRVAGRETGWPQRPTLSGWNFRQSRLYSLLT